MVLIYLLKVILFHLETEEQALVKGCVRYLNRCTTSPTYILYQLNEKNELTITYHVFSGLKHCHFLKRRLPATSSFPQTTLCL